MLIEVTDKGKKVVAIRLPLWMLKSRLIGNILKKGFNSKYRRKEGSVKPQAQDFEKTNFRKKNATLQSTTISAEEIAPDCVEKDALQKATDFVCQSCSADIDGASVECTPSVCDTAITKNGEAHLSLASDGENSLSDNSSAKQNQQLSAKKNNSQFTFTRSQQIALYKAIKNYIRTVGHFNLVEVESDGGATRVIVRV